MTVRLATAADAAQMTTIWNANAPTVRGFWPANAGGSAAVPTWTTATATKLVSRSGRRFTVSEQPAGTINGVLGVIKAGSIDTAYIWLVRLDEHGDRRANADAVQPQRSRNVQVAYDHVGGNRRMTVRPCRRHAWLPLSSKFRASYCVLCLVLRWDDGD